jgi:hypothetical protein
MFPENSRLARETKRLDQQFPSGSLHPGPRSFSPLRYTIVWFAANCVLGGVA